MYKHHIHLVSGTEAQNKNVQITENSKKTCFDFGYSYLPHSYICGSHMAPGLATATTYVNMNTSSNMTTSFSMLLLPFQGPLQLMSQIQTSLYLSTPPVSPTQFFAHLTQRWQPAANISVRYNTHSDAPADCLCYLRWICMVDAVAKAFFAFIDHSCLLTSIWIYCCLLWVLIYASSTSRVPWTQLYFAITSVFHFLFSVYFLPVYNSAGSQGLLEFTTCFRS